MATKRVIVVGASGYHLETPSERVRSVPWNRLDTLPNVRDFNVVIINALDPTPDVAEWVRLFAAFDGQILADLLASGTELIVVGDPRFEVVLNSRKVPFSAFTGARFHWEVAAGDSVTVLDLPNFGQYRRYLERVHRWSFALQYVFPLSSVGTLYGANTNAAIPLIPLARNRYGGVLAAAWTQRGNAVWLPPSSMSTDEALTLLVRDVGGIDISPSNIPEWAEQIVAPGQAAIDVELNGIQQRLTTLSDDLERIKGVRASVREVLGLLYERGPRLERVILRTISQLDADVTEPIDPGKEDGWFSVARSGATGEAVLEVKSTTNNTFDEGGVRQLLEWVARGESDGKNYKGVFIGLSAAGKPFDSKSNPFSDGFRRTAERFDLVALRSEDLYLAYELHAERRITSEEFWKTVFKTTGIYDPSWMRAMKP